MTLLSVFKILIQFIFPSGNHDQYESFSWFLNGSQYISEPDSSIIITQEGNYEIQLYGCDTISQNFEYTHYDPSPLDLTFSDTTICEWDYLSLEFSLANYESFLILLGMAQMDFILQIVLLNLVQMGLIILKFMDVSHYQIHFILQLILMIH